MGDSYDADPGLERFRYLTRGVDPAWRRVVGRVIDVRHVGWDVGVRLMERVAGHRRGSSPDPRLTTSARDLISTRGRAVRGAVREEVEALADAVMRAGRYPARDEANRALRAVMVGLRERLPDDLVARLVEHLPAAALPLDDSERSKAGDLG